MNISGRDEILLENMKIGNFSVNITERDRNLLKNLIISSFSLKLVIFLEIYNFSIKDTKRECISLENLIFFTNFTEIYKFHDFPLFNENLSFWFRQYPICFWLQA